MKHRRLGMIDAFLIVVLLLSGVGIALRIHARGDGAVVGDVRGGVMVVARQAPASCADCIEIGETLYTADGNAFGRVIDVIRAPSRIYLYEDGKECVGEWDEQKYCDLTLLLEVEGTYDGAVFLQAGRYPVIMGKTVSLHGERVSLPWLVKEVKNSF